MVDVFKKAASLPGHKQNGGTCCGTCSFSRHMFNGVYVCVRSDLRAVVGLLDCCDLFERSSTASDNKE